MAVKSNTVTISLEEYKELLLKERPSNEDKQMLDKFIRLFREHLVYEKNDWSSNPMKNVDVKDADGFFKDACTLIKLLDFNLYMEIWNDIQTKERERKANEERIKQMNLAKEIRNDNE